MKKNIVLTLGIMLCLASCMTKKDFLYLNNVDPGIAYTFNHPDTRVHAGDKLSIVVSSKSPELAVPFNANGGAFLTVGNNGTIDANAMTRNTYYHVDDKGFIDFPLLGKLHIEGLSANEVETLIKNKIIAGKYINNPIVIMEFQNFRYTMLGASANGTQTAPDGHITILEAIANAGGVGSNGNMKRVLVYREENGKMVMYVNDLTDRAIFESPCYQLQQNDIVYVEPKYRKTTFANNGQKMLYILTSVMTGVSAILFFTNIFKK